MRTIGLLLAIAALTCAAKDVQFRCDYQYDKRTDRYYKYHEIPATWEEAQLRCYLEGAVLASPLNNEILTTLGELMRNFSDVNDALDKRILIGAAAKLSKGDFVTIEGVPINQLVAKWDNNEPIINENDDDSVTLNSDGRLSIQSANNHFPYICYKKNKLPPFNVQCGTTDPNYVLYSTGSCYKFHRVPRIWSSAHMACEAEGGYLTIINSNEEAEIIKKIFALNPNSSMVGTFDKEYAHIGFLDFNEHSTWRTIHGLSLEDAGYSQFAPGEPNNIIHGNGEFCGSVKRSGGLNDIHCQSVTPFICEKDPQTLLTKYCV